jgi:membrane AbrB-like protein
MRAARDSWINPALALVLCAAAGALFSWLRTPLPWMIGPLLVVALCNFSGARLRSVPGSRQFGQLIIGTALGLYFTPAVAREVASSWPLLLIAAFFAIALAWACGWFLSRVGGTDRTTAFFASVPGGAAEMAVLGERFGARVDHVVFAQSLRVLIVVVVVPFAFAYSGVHGSDAYSPVGVPLDWSGLALLLGLAAVVGALLALLGAPNPFMFGPLLMAIALTVGEVQLSSIPGPVSNLGQLFLGCALATRFEKEFLSGLGRYAGAALASIFLAMLLAAVFGAGLAWVWGIPTPSLILATAPGGIAEMCITAKVLQLGVPLVTAAHVTRVLILINATAPIYRIVKRWSSGRCIG